MREALRWESGCRPAWVRGRYSGQVVEAEVKGALGRVRGRRVDRGFVSQELLDVVARDRVSAFPWRGQFTPGLVGILLDSYAQAGASVLDPFAGSGTTLAEATRRGMAATGAEVNPAALELARVFTFTELTPAERKDVLGRVRRRLMEIIVRGNDGPTGDASRDLREEVTDSYRSASSAYEANVIAVAMMLAMGDQRSLEGGRLDRALSQVSEVVAGLPPDVVPCSVHLADARKLPVGENSVDLVITSPPYINVFNYHQNYRPAIESLGWNVLAAAKTEIGANRKHRQNRFLTVVQYAQDMMLAMCDFQRVCRAGAHAIIVIGRESRVRGVAFPNGEIVGCLAELMPGFEFVRWQERSFTNRFGGKIHEEILTFQVTPAGDGADLLPLATETGRQMLVAARSRAGSPGIAGEVDAAIEGSGLVRPSTEFTPVRTPCCLALGSRVGRRAGAKSGRFPGLASDYDQRQRSLRSTAVTERACLASPPLRSRTAPERRVLPVHEPRFRRAEDARHGDAAGGWSMRTRLPEGSRTAKSRVPQNWPAGSWTISAPEARTFSKAASRSSARKCTPFRAPLAMRDAIMSLSSGLPFR